MFKWPGLKESMLLAAVVFLAKENPRLLAAWLVYAIWKNRQEFFV